jgi:hypothetical protein
MGQFQFGKLIFYEDVLRSFRLDSLLGLNESLAVSWALHHLTKVFNLRRNFNSGVV